MALEQKSLSVYSKQEEGNKPFSNFKKPWSVKEKRCFHRISSGCKVAFYQKKRLRCITLTSSDVANTENDISRDVKVLIQRIRRKYPDFEYIRINVLKDNRWHVHMLYKGSFMPVRWLKYQWSVLHQSPIVYITEMDGSYGLVNYFARQYLASQEGELTYMSYSQGWLFRGAVRVWKACLCSCRDYSHTHWDTRYGESRGFWHFSVDIKKALYIWNVVLYRFVFSKDTGFYIFDDCVDLDDFGLNADFNVLKTVCKYCGRYKPMEV
jgi:hypothetical protein